MPTGFAGHETSHNSGPLFENTELMKYSKDFNLNKTLDPEIVDRLKQIPDELVFASDHSPPLRHPGAVFNIAYSEISDSIIETATLANRLNAKYEDSEIQKRLNTETEKLYKNVCSLVDESYLVLIGITEAKTSNRKFAYEWLQENNVQAAQRFHGSIKSDAEFFQNVNNRLKHNNQRLSFCQMDSSVGSVLGHFIEGTDPNGSVCPDTTFHNVGKIGQYISFNWLLLYSMVFTQVLADYLLKAVRSHLSLKGFKFPRREIVGPGEQELWSTLSRIDNLFFPFEKKMGFPKVRKEGSIYRLTFPHGDTPTQGIPISYKVTYHADGYARQFHIPGG